MEIKVTLSIGYPSATHVDIIEIPQSDIDNCDNSGEVDDLCNDYAQEWANNYIEVWYKVVE